LPEETAVTVLPETVATFVLLEVKIPPENPEGAEAVAVSPGLRTAAERLTLAVGQEGPPGPLPHA